MDFGPHAGFIFASYALCVMTVMVLVAWVRFDKAAQDKALQDLADQGITRSRPEDRSTPPA